MNYEWQEPEDGKVALLRLLTGSRRRGNAENGL